MIDAADIITLTTRVTREWTKQRKAEERNRNAALNRRDRLGKVQQDAFTAVAADILPEAYDKVSDDGRFPAAKRQLYYASRQAFQDATGREIDWKYFSGTVLVKFLNENPDMTAAWKVTADPRGTLTIPNGEHPVRIPCGTLMIDEHLRRHGTAPDPAAAALDLPGSVGVAYPSLAAGVRYQALLYIEKEGFEPLLQAARIGERFGVAVLSCKGQSVVAARKFADQVCRVNGGVPLLVAHDFDKAGFEICQCLTRVSAAAIENNTVKYRFRNQINVIDLGLKLADVERWRLDAETCRFKGRFPADTICTPDEQRFLRSGRRVELNAFTSPQFIEWLETKLTEQGLAAPLIPDDATLAAAYRRGVTLAKINASIAAARVEAVHAGSVPVPDRLRERLCEEIVRSGMAWDRALYELAALDREGHR